MVLAYYPGRLSDKAAKTSDGVFSEMKGREREKKFFTKLTTSFLSGGDFRVSEKLKRGRKDGERPEFSLV